MPTNPAPRIYKWHITDISYPALTRDYVATHAEFNDSAARQNNYDTRETESIDYLSQQLEKIQAPTAVTNPTNWQFRFDVMGLPVITLDTDCSTIVKLAKSAPHRFKFYTTSEGTGALRRELKDSGCHYDAGTPLIKVPEKPREPVLTPQGREKSL